MDKTSRLGRELTLEEVHERSKEILRYIDDECKRLKISFFLLGGSALGAVRHQDVIPWDDDIDIGIIRNEYNQFVSSFANTERFNIITIGKTNNYCLPYAKVVDCETIIFENIARQLEEKGLFVDVFPIDYVENENLHLNVALILKKAYFHGYIYDSKNDVYKKLPAKKRAFGCLSRAAARHAKPEKIANNITKYATSSSPTSYLMNFWGAWGMREVMKKEWFGQGVYAPFGTDHYLIPSNYDKYLSKLYGDYMTPPIDPPQYHGSVFMRLSQRDSELI